MESVTIAGGNSDMLTLSGNINPADRFFNFTNPQFGQVTEPKQDLDDIIKQEISGTKGILDKIKSTSPDTKLSDKQIMDLYNNSFVNDGMLIF